MTTLTGEPCWIELFTPDTDAAAAFYGELFGWTATDPGEEYGGYRLFEREGRPVAGLMRNDGSMGTRRVVGLPRHRRRRRDRREGARVGREVVAGPMQVGDLGTMAVLVDPAGAAVGAWQAARFPGTMRPRGRRRADLVRDAQQGLRHLAGVLPRRLRLADPHDERHPGLPLHHARPGRGRPRRDRGRRRRTLGDAASAVAVLPAGRRHATTAGSRGRSASAVATPIPLDAPDHTRYGRLAVLLDPAGVHPA